MSTFHERKAQRTEHYKRFVHGWKLARCGACNGSGYYDHNGSPPCGACDGTGFLSEPIDDDEMVQMLMDRDMGDS